MQVRKPTFDFSQISRYYFADNAWVTHTMNALHVIVPIGELFFIRAVPGLADQAPAAQKQDIRKFIGQESVHDQVHRQFWQTLREQKLPVDVFAEFFRSTAIDTMEPIVERLLGKKFLLAATVGFEHYTAALADIAFAPGSRLLSSMQKDVADMMRWHAAEEIEHKSVAFRQLQSIDDSYLLRAGGMVLASSLLTFYTIAGTAWFIAGDRELTLARLIKDLPQLPQIARGLVTGVIRHNAEYFMPGFDPDTKNNYPRAEAALRELGLAIAS
ncbi:MAG: metal-dependent hydrolase [Turneriella sp.]